MQDLRSLANGGGAGRIFGGDRRLRPFPNQALKCPRCDSLNTKFCYYNNYNLSQPRHFCKSCRRYWTKGGVLRNVPVGGGCRKTKRSKPKSSPDLQKEKKSTSHSSSDSSSLTATTNNEAASSSSAAALLNFTDSGLLSQTTTTTTNNPNSTFETSIMQQLNTLDHQAPADSGIFPESGSFTSLMTTASNHGYLGFNLSDISPFRLHHHQQQQQQEEHQQQQQQEQQQQIELEQQKMTSIVDELKLQFDQKNDQLKLQELTKGFYDQTVPGEMPGLPNRTVNGELTALDWQSSSDHHQGLFDLPSTVDQSYWSQSSQWTDNDHPLYLP